jgi:hypothetical protein
MQFLGARLQSAGYHVYIPLTVGHGLPKGSCNPATRPGAVCVQDYPIDKLPTNKEGYINYTQWAVDMVKEEIALYAPKSKRARGFFVGTAGLSLGGPLAAMATFLGKGLFQKTVLVNPFYSAAVPVLDFNVLHCQKSANPNVCISNFVNGLLKIDQATASNITIPDVPVGVYTLLKNFEASALKEATFQVDKFLGNMLLNHYVDFMQFITRGMIAIEENKDLSNSSFVTSPYGWGQGCIDSTNRPGYCSFQIRNLIAVNSFGMYSLSRSKKISNSKLALMTTARDGMVRDGVIYSAASQFAQGTNNSVSFCMYRPQPSCPILSLIDSNDCGVPHSSFSRAENLGQAPYHMYWESDLLSNVQSFFLGTKTNIGTKGATDRAICSAFALNNRTLYADLIADARGIVEDAVNKWPN